MVLWWPELTCNLNWQPSSPICCWYHWVHWLTRMLKNSWKPFVPSPWQLKNTYTQCDCKPNQNNPTKPKLKHIINLTFSQADVKNGNSNAACIRWNMTSRGHNLFIETVVLTVFKYFALINFMKCVNTLLRPILK